MRYSKDEKYMLRCLQLAQIGMRNAMPNPCVGAVIVYKDTIIGEGFTSAYGGAHAEVNAIQSVTQKELLPESTLYVTLEPCSHHGKTPPCAELIIAQKIKRVVIGTVDPFEEVSGKGVALLAAHGIDVKVGILENECREMHKRFLCMVEHKRPYILLKYALSADGFLAPHIKDEKRPAWLTNIYSRQRVHQQRSEEQAVLVGTQTVLEDNPSLTTRDWTGKHPTRIYIDRNHKIDHSYGITSVEAQTICITEKLPQHPIGSIIYECVSFDEKFIQHILQVAYNHKIQSLIVEGGAKTIQQFIDHDLWDEAYVYESPKMLYSGILAPKIHSFVSNEKKWIADDLLTIYKNKN